MLIRFWGVRGSIASPGPDTAAVGGNTSCVEVVCGKTRIVLDAGTGLRGLGNHLLREGQPLDLTLLLSHYHWDHIQGLPFFVPVYMKQSNLTIVGGSNGVMSVKEALVHQMTAPVFPVRLDEVGASIATREVKLGETFDVGEARVTVAKGNHPGGVVAYRIEHEGKSLVYATDTEHYAAVDPALRTLSMAPTCSCTTRSTRPRSTRRRWAGDTRPTSRARSSRAPPGWGSTCSSITTRCAPIRRSPTSRRERRRCTRRASPRAKGWSSISASLSKGGARPDARCPSVSSAFSHAEDHVERYLRESDAAARAG